MCTVFIKDINKAIQFEITSFQEVQQQLDFICLEYNKGMLFPACLLLYSIRCFTMQNPAFTIISS